MYSHLAFPVLVGFFLAIYLASSLSSRRLTQNRQGKFPVFANAFFLLVCWAFAGLILVTELFQVTGFSNKKASKEDKYEPEGWFCSVFFIKVYAMVLLFDFGIMNSFEIFKYLILSV